MELLAALAPETVLTAWGLVLLLLAGARHGTEEDQRLSGQLTLVALISGLLTVWWSWTQSAPDGGISNMLALDGFRFATATIVLLGAALSVLVSLGYWGRERIFVPECYPLLLFATVGMLVMCAAADLILVFLGIELMSLCVYVLVGINRRSVHGAEGALKYFLLGAFASGFLLYGIALIYGASGTTSLSLIAARSPGLGLGSDLMMLAGIALLLIGFAFKVAAVPFHMWTPDVYDGAPTPVTGFMAAAVKTAGFAALMRILVVPLADAAPSWSQVIWWLAAVTMIGGNLMALAQRRIKRMLAYSSIGHAGYLLTAAASGTVTAAGAYVFYIFAYTLMTVGAFAVVAIAGRGGERDVMIDDFAGLSAERPWLAFAMSVFMLSLLGFPGTAGFIGKWFVLSSAVESGQWTLGIILVVASVMSAGYYLPVIMQMYMQPARSPDAHESTVAVGATRFVIAATSAALLLFGVWPGAVLDTARAAGQDLLPSVEYTLADEP